MTESNNKLGEVFVRCWEDDAFKAKFLANPKSVLAEAGIKTEMDIEVVQNTHTKIYITLPAKPAEAGELSDAQLEGASGGAGIANLNPLSTAAATAARRTLLNTKQYATSGVPAGYCYQTPC